MISSVVVPSSVRRFLMLLVGVVSIAVVLATLGRAPVAQAALLEEPVPVSQDAEGAANAESRVDGDEEEICILDGALAVDDWDCVTLRVVKGASSPKGGKVRLKGKVRLDWFPGARNVSSRGDYAQAGQVVVIERAKDGTRWTDEGKRWKRVATVVADDRGNFAKSVKLRKRGLYTFRAVVRDVSSRQVRQDSSATSDSVTATAGVPGYGYSLTNDSKHDLNLECLGQMGDGEARATEAVDFSEGKDASCLFVGGTGLAGGFRLIQKNPIIGDPSVYSFVGDSNDGNPCKDMAQPELKDRDIVRVSIKDAGFWGLGYTGTMTYPDGSSCNFRMLTSTQEVLAGQPTWAKVLEIAIGVVVILAVAFFVGAAIIGGGGAAAGEAAVVAAPEVGAAAAEELFVDAYYYEMVADNVAGTVWADFEIVPLYFA